MDNVTHPLADEALILETESAPSPEHVSLAPERFMGDPAEQMPQFTPPGVPPCGAGAPTPVPVPQDPTIVVVVQQLLPKFPNIDPNVVYCIAEELLRVPPPSRPADMASAILAGRYGMREIVETGLGYDYAEFKQDMRRAYGRFDHVADQVAAARAVVNAFRNKYGLDISLQELQDCEDDETYWRTKLAAAVEKVEKNRIAVGDEVIIVASNKHFGKVGTLMSLTDDAAEVMVDNIANNPISVGQPFVNLRLPSGTEKRAMLRLAAEQPTAAAVWYREVGATVYAKQRGLEPVTLHKVAHTIRACPHPVNTGDIAEDVNLDNLVAVYGRIADITNVVALKVEPTTARLDAIARSAVYDLLDELVTDRHVEDMSVRFSGDRGYYIVVNYDRPERVGYYQEKVARVVRTYIQHSTSKHLVMGPATTPDKVAVLTDIRTVPAAYSIHEDTGLVCQPLDPMKLDGFDSKQATISGLSETYGFGIKA